MTLKKRGLGRGLSELGLGELLGGKVNSAIMDSTLEPTSEAVQAAQVIATERALPNESLQQLELDALKPGRYQPRQQFSPEKLEELAESIRRQGIIQPIVVRNTEQGYEILAGERRWRAARLAGLETVPVVIRNISDENAIAISLIENIQRHDLNAIEQAQALQRLIDEFSLTHDQAAIAVGKNRASITNLLRLLKLPEMIRDYVQQGKLDMGHARALLALDMIEQIKFAKIIIEQELSVRETEKRIKQLLEPQVEKFVPTANVDPNIRRLERDISDILAARVSIQHQNNGAGKLVIHYTSSDELDGILAHIK